MNFWFYAFFFYFLLCEGFCNFQAKISMFGSAKPNILAIGSSTTLYCKITLQSKPDFKQRWYTPSGGDIAEDCSLYDSSDSMRAFCNESESDKYGKLHGLHINKVSWLHRGNWVCRYSSNITTIFLDVHVPTVVHELRVTPFPDSASSQLLGTGTKDHPYDLRGGLDVQLTCITKCSYPKTQLTFKFKSVYRNVGADLLSDDLTDSEPHTINKTYLQNDEQCAQDKIDLLRPSVLRTRFINCKSAGMDGLTSVHCISSATNYQAESQKQMYFMCPDFPNTWAMLPADASNVLKISSSQSGDLIDDVEMKLTVGETVAIVMGGFISVLLLIGLVLVVKRQVRLNYTAVMTRRSSFGERDIVEL